MKDEKPYLEFDAEGVKRHYQELSRNRWMQEGRKEVVEFVEKRILPFDFGSVFSKAPISFVEWQAKLKDWGIGKPLALSTKELERIARNATFGAEVR